MFVLFENHEVTIYYIVYFLNMSHKEHEISLPKIHNPQFTLTRKPTLTEKDLKASFFRNDISFSIELSVTTFPIVRTRWKIS